MSDSIFRVGDRVTFVPGMADQYADEAEITGLIAAPHPLDGLWPVISYEKDGESRCHQVHPSHIGAVVNRDVLRDRLRASRGERVPLGGRLVLTMTGGCFDDLAYHETDESAMKAWRKWHGLGDDVEYDDFENESYDDCYIMDLDEILGRSVPDETTERTWAWQAGRRDMGNRIDIPHETVAGLRAIGRERLVASIEEAGPGPNMKVTNTQRQADDMKRLLRDVVTEILDQTTPENERQAENWAKKLRLSAEVGVSICPSLALGVAEFLEQIASGSDG
jgi:hypothetical protein